MERKRPDGRGLIEFVLDNLTDLVTIGLVVVLLIRHQVNPFGLEDIPDFIAWLLAVLALIAVTSVWQRNNILKRIETLTQENKEISLRLVSKPRANAFFVDPSAPDPVSGAISAAMKVDLLGITLTRTVREHMHEIGRRLADGAHIRVAVIDGQLDGVNSAMAKRSMGETTPDFWRDRMRTVEALLDEIARNANGQGTLEVAFIPFIPSFGMMLLDANKAKGRCRVEVYHHCTAEPNASFWLDPVADTYWYTFYREQFDHIWSRSRTRVLVGNGAQ